MKYVALLRGINVGGKNILPMKALLEMFEDAGASDVVNYIQSGNVVFSASASVAQKAADRVRGEITKRFGFTVPLVLRSATELAEIPERNPFAKQGDADAWHIMFLEKATKPSDAALLDPNRSTPDAFVVDGREVFLFCPNGFGKTKLTNAYFDSKLKTVSTVRNWRTLLKLIAMASSRLAQKSWAAV